MEKRFEADVVAKLPFVPFGILQNITHRGLPGEDYTDCSMTFMLVLCSMSIRTNIAKILGLFFFLFFYVLCVVCCVCICGVFVGCFRCVF